MAARLHADLFTPAEAAAYLRLCGPDSLQALREHEGLVAVKLGKGYLYHRHHLDAFVERFFGIPREKRR